VKIDQSEVGIVRFGRGDGIVGIVRDGDDAVPRIVLDELLQRRCQLRIILDNQYLEHDTPPPITRRMLIRNERDANPL
jgi:hypothetical protein